MRIWVTSKNQEWVSSVTGIPLETLQENYKRIRAGRGIYTITMTNEKEEMMDFHPYVFQDKARKIVFEYVMDHLDKSDDRHKTFSEDDVYVVWFSKTLGNWKALVSTTLPDGMYYELTHNGVKHETYLDVYKKFQNYVVPDHIYGLSRPSAGKFKHFLQCAAVTNGCESQIMWEDNREDINAEWLRDQGWELQAGRWICEGQHTKPSFGNVVPD